MGLGAFAVATLVGLDAGNPSSQVLARSLGAMAVCYVVGLCIGAVGERVVDAESGARRARLGVDRALADRKLELAGSDEEARAAA